MARNKKDSVRARNKELDRRKRRVRVNPVMAPRAKLSQRQLARLDDAYVLIQRCEYDQAEELLKQLDSRNLNCAEVVDALVYLYQETKDHQSGWRAASRLTKLSPNDADAWMMLAQESLFCDRPAIALRNYQRVVQKWPDHEHVGKARTAIDVIHPEIESRISAIGFDKVNGLRWFTLHEESLGFLQDGDFLACAEKCRELLAEAPTFVSARNNLAIAHFQSGRPNDAVAVVEETRRLNPDNRFAETMLAKLYFLSGRATEAHQLADQIVANPPSTQDAIVMALELLAILGRDEELVTLAETRERDVIDNQNRGVRYHYLAYAKCRMGDRKAAETLWKKCLKFIPNHPEARANLQDLEEGLGQAPWAVSITKWIPDAVLDEVLKTARAGSFNLQAGFPAIASLVPALLDRGDPPGREVALGMAMDDGSPTMIEAIKAFAFGSRGPDSKRYDALRFLSEKGVINAGPHRIHNRGQWTDIQLFTAEISPEPLPNGSSDRVKELVSSGTRALFEGNYALAEAKLNEALEEQPGNCTAIYNLCTIWLKRDGIEGERRARVRLEQLYRDSPDYTFAAISLAQFAAMDGEFKKANDLLLPILQAKKLHVSEAAALFGCQAQIAIAENDLNAAERAYDLMYQVGGDHELKMAKQVRRLIDFATPQKGLLQKFLPAFKR